MSTRANIIITDGYSHQIFYRHSDGYPEGVKPTLQKFIDWVAAGKIRNNTGQAAGWLITLGALEYQSVPKLKRGSKKYSLNIEEPADGVMDWKVGAYEPTDCVHGDIEYLYVVDLKKLEVRVSQTWNEINHTVSLEDSVKKFYANTKVAASGDSALYDLITEVRNVAKQITTGIDSAFIESLKGKVIIKPTPKRKPKAEKKPVVALVTDGKNTIVLKTK